MRTVTCYIVLVFWSVVDGLVDAQKGTNNSANDPLEALIAIRDLKEKTLILLRDFQLFLQDPNPILIRQLKDVLQMAKTKSKTLIILGCRMVLPPELERELTVIEFALPGKEELGAVLGGIMESANIKNMENEQREKVIDAASGLTTMEAENAFALSVVQSKAIDPVIVAKCSRGRHAEPLGFVQERNHAQVAAQEIGQAAAARVARVVRFTEGMP